MRLLISGDMGRRRIWKRKLILYLQCAMDVEQCPFLYHRTDLLSTFPTKRTPITNVQFTSRNLCLVGGTYLSPEVR